MPDGTNKDAPLQDLPFGEQFLLWAMRQWVRGHGGKGGAQATLYKGFHLAGIEEGYLALDELMTVIAYSARTEIEVRCPYCDGISPDEESFLGLFAALQRSDFQVGRAILARWLTATGVRLAQTPAVRLAWIMAHGGLTLRRQGVGARAGEGSSASSPRASARVPASTTVH